jgi:hypothetical protein
MTGTKRENNTRRNIPKEEKANKTRSRLLRYNVMILEAQNESTILALNPNKHPNLFGAYLAHHLNH